MFTALIDTGASNTSLAKSVAQRLTLPILGKGQMTSAGGVHAIDLYMADLGLVFGGPTANVQEAYPLLDFTLMEFNGGGADFDVLLGRDILCRGHLSVMGFNNRFMFCL